MDLINGRPTGSVRISFGYMSTLADAETFLNFIAECFVEKAHRLIEAKSIVSPSERNFSTKFDVKQSNLEANSFKTKGVEEDLTAAVYQDATLSQVCETGLTQVQETSEPDSRYVVGLNGFEAEIRPPPGGKVLTNIYLYPVKSCSAFEVSIHVPFFNYLLLVQIHLFLHLFVSEKWKYETYTLQLLYLFRTCRHTTLECSPSKQNSRSKGSRIARVVGSNLTRVTWL